jgi:general nucleoside transport system permease protein
MIGYGLMADRSIGPAVLERRGAISRRTSVLLRAAAIALALVVGGLVLMLAGLPLAGSYRTMWNGSLGSSSALAQTLVASTPLILTGLSVVLARRAGVWNLGGEGQLYMGAVFATAVALWFPNTPRLFLVPAMLAAGILGGAVWSLGPALLKTGVRINEIISTLLLNVVAILVVAHLVSGRWRDPLALGFPVSRELPGNAAMPALFGTAVHAGFLIAIVAAFVLWLVPSWPGRNLRPRNLIIAMLASGALAGIAGMGQISAVTHRLGTDISANYGYVGIVVAALSWFSPLGVLVVAIPVGALLAGGFALRNAGASAWVVAVLQSSIVAILLATEFLARFRIRPAVSRGARDASPEPGS